jgi:hypothetical protein
MNAVHLAAYMEATEGAVAEFTLNELTCIGWQPEPGYH